MTDPAPAKSGPRIGPMPCTSAWASPPVVRAQHTPGMPSKRYGSPDGWTGVKPSQTPTVRKHIGRPDAAWPCARPPAYANRLVSGSPSPACLVDSSSAGPLERPPFPRPRRPHPSQPRSGSRKWRSGEPSSSGPTSRSIPCGSAGCGRAAAGSRGGACVQGMRHRVVSPPVGGIGSTPCTCAPM
jgi:hypothetical protein